MWFFQFSPHTSRANLYSTFKEITSLLQHFSSEIEPYFYPVNVVLNIEDNTVIARSLFSTSSFADLLFQFYSSFASYFTSPFPSLYQMRSALRLVVRELAPNGRFQPKTTTFLLRSSPCTFNYVQDRPMSSQFLVSSTFLSFAPRLSSYLSMAWWFPCNRIQLWRKCLRANLVVVQEVDKLVLFF